MTLEFAKYALVGSSATAAHYATLLSLVEGGGVNPTVAAAAGATCGAIVAYLGNRRFTFDATAPHAQAIPRFLFVTATAAALHASIVWLGTEVFGFHYLAPQLAATALALASGFILNRHWTFA